MVRISWRFWTYPRAPQGEPCGTELTTRARYSVRVARPHSALLAIFRAPIWLYRLGLGRLLGHRFLLLVHRGRRSGKLHRTVLEVMRYDRAGDESVVMAGFGARSDWLRNLEAGGGVMIETGGRRFVPDHRMLGTDEAAAVLADYERRNRAIARILRAVLSRLVGWRYDPSSAARRRLVTELPLVGLRPQSGAADRG